MAGILIVDAWLRSPMAYPTYQRALMVVAEAWSEQRVLMRAHADCPDRTQPSIVLHGSRLAIGPASVDPHGPWGIHVDRPVDGRAQQLKGQLELAARRLSHHLRSMAERAEPARARVAPAPPSGDMPAPAGATGAGNPGVAEARVDTIRGYALGPGVQTGAGAGWRSPGSPGSMGQSVPRGLPLTAEEHRVLDALNTAGTLSARQVARIAGAPDGAVWMSAFMARLAAWGVDVIASGGNPGSEPVYVRKR